MRSIGNKTGFSLIEMIVYVSVLSIILAVVISTLISFSSTYREVAAKRAADHAAMDALERMTREIRTAANVNTSQSTFGSSPGVLTLTQTGTTTRFYVQNGALQMDMNGVYVGPLTSSSSAITNLVFTLLSTSTSKAIKINITIVGTSGSASTTKNYYSTVVLKGAEL